MKNLLIALVLCSSLALQAQKVDVYMEDMQLFFPGSPTHAPCDLEGGESELRVSLKVNGHRVAIVGHDGAKLNNDASIAEEYYTADHTTKIMHDRHGKEKIKLGNFDRSEVIEVRFDIWEDDGCGDEWAYSTDCWVDDDDDHPDTEVVVSLDKGLIKYKKKAKDCVEVRFKLTDR